MAVIGFKQCRVCKFTKPLRKFSKHSNYNDGYESQCLECKKKVKEQRKSRSQ